MHDTAMRIKASLYISPFCFILDTFFKSLRKTVRCVERFFKKVSQAKTKKKRFPL